MSNDYLIEHCLGEEIGVVGSQGARPTPWCLRKTFQFRKGSTAIARPKGVAFDDAGNVYAAGTGNGGTAQDQNLIFIRPRPPGAGASCDLSGTNDKARETGAQP